MTSTENAETIYQKNYIIICTMSYNNPKKRRDEYEIILEILFLLFIIVFILVVVNLGCYLV
jgi:hypothetical protein